MCFPPIMIFYFQNWRETHSPPILEGFMYLSKSSDFSITHILHKVKQIQ